MILYPQFPQILAAALRIVRVHCVLALLLLVHLLQSRLDSVLLFVDIVVLLLKGTQIYLLYLDFLRLRQE